MDIQAEEIKLIVGVNDVSTLQKTSNFRSNNTKEVFEKTWSL